MNKNKKTIIICSIILFIIVSVIILYIFMNKNKFVFKNISLNYGDSFKIDLDNKYNYDDLEWISSNPDIVDIVDGNVIFKSNEDANVVITVKDKEGNEDSFEIEIIKKDEIVNVEKIDLSKYKNLELKLNDKIQINVNIIPSNATNKNVIYKSSVPDSVKIDANGNVTVLNDNVDSVIISATSIDGNFYDGVTIKIIKDESKEEIDNKPIDIQSLSFEKNELSLNTGDYFSLQSILNLNPINSDRTKLEWSYGITDKNAPVIEVDKSNGVVRALRGGTSTVVVKYKNLSTSIRINVNNHNKITGSFLKTGGTNIVKEVNGKEMPILLKGINVGAWLSRSYSMSAFVPLSKSDIQNNKYGVDSCINNLSFYGALSSNNRSDGKLSKDNVYELSTILYDNFITEEDFDLMAQMGINVIRLPVEYSFFTQRRYYNGVENQSEISPIIGALNYIENIVRIAGERGIYTIIDLHLVKGRQNSGGWCDDAKFYGNATYQKEMVDLWGHIAFRFKDNTMVAGYELLNEPEGNIKEVVSYYNAAYTTIRKYDKNHIIIMDENCVVCGYDGASTVRENDNVGDLPDPSKTYSEMEKEGKITGKKLQNYSSKNIKWENVVYSTHDYTYKSSDQDEKTNNGNDISLLLTRLKQRLKNVSNKSKSYNVPYYVGEFSFFGKSQQRTESPDMYKQYLQVWSAALDLYERYGFSYTPWTYKANNDMYYGLVFWGTKENASYGINCDESNVNYNCIKANLLKDDYAVLKEKFSYKSYENMKFNEDFYFMFLEQFNSRRIVSSIKTDISNLEMKVGDIKFVNTTVTPNTAINKKLNWLSSNPKVVSVDYDTGMIKAVGKGSAKITIINSPFDKYIDKDNNKKNYVDIYKCKKTKNSSIDKVSLNDYSCFAADIYSNKKSVSTIINVVVK